MILLSVETLGRKLNHADSLDRKPLVLEGSKGSPTVLAEARYDR